MTNLNLSFAEAEFFHKLTEPFINRIAIKTAQLIQSTQTTAPDPADDLITPREASELLKCSMVSIWRYEKKGRIQSFGIGGKKYFKRSLLLQSIVKK